MNQFGGRWTEEKLAILRGYLNAYVLVMKKQKGWVRTWYVDAFAGPGHSVHRGDADLRTLLDGSPTIALECNPPFDRFLFIEKEKSNVESLQKLVSSHALCDRVEIQCADANDALVDFCRRMQRQDRAVVFLDPFATQVDWTTISRLAETGKCDVWILFPTSAINRMIPQSGQIPDSWQRSLDRVMGCQEWRTAFLIPSPIDDLFDSGARLTKAVSAEEIARYFHGRLDAAFPCVLPATKTLLNSKNSPLFTLMFAVSNPSERAQKPALRVANHLLKAL